jgi:alpha-tubulin suppressor-like RCC1 family protein
VAGGSETGYALESNGTAWAWGDGQYGQLGNGSNKKLSDVPVRVSGLSDVVALAGGNADGYAVRRDGTVWAWGVGLGQLGNGTNSSESDVPVQVSGLSDVVAVAGGDSDGYALRRDGTVWAWGLGPSGQLGDGTYSSESDVPVQVHDLTGVVAIAAFSSDDSDIALCRNGTVWHWGAAPNGETAGTTSDVAAEVRGLSHVVAIAGGYDTEFALLRDGTVRAWGDDADGELGNGDHTAVVSVPIPIHGLNQVLALAGGTADDYAIVASRH